MEGESRYQAGARNPMPKENNEKKQTVSLHHPVGVLQLGKTTTVHEEQILGIFDMDTATVSAVTKQFLSTAQKRGQVVLAAEELPKSFVVTDKRSQKQSIKNNGSVQASTKEHCVYLSQFAPQTLAQRSQIQRTEKE